MHQMQASLLELKAAQLEDTRSLRHLLTAILDEKDDSFKKSSGRRDSQGSAGSMSC